MSIIIDSNSETNQNYYYGIYDSYGEGYKEVGQSFTGTTATLDSAKWYLQRFRNPTGNLVAKIYNHSGTFGTSSLPTGTALATSGTVLCSSVSTSAFGLVTFTFTGANAITLIDGTKYVVTINAGSASTGPIDYIRVGSGPNTHSGNGSYDDATWKVLTGTADFCFYVYGTPILTHVRTQIGSNRTLASRTLADRTIIDSDRAAI